MKKTIILLVITFLLMGCLPLPAQNKSVVHKLCTTAKDTAKIKAILVKTDSVLTKIVKIDTAKVNQIINMSEMDDTTKEQVKSIVGDIPEAAKKADEIVKIIQNKDQYSSNLEYYLYLIGALITFLTFIGGMVKKIKSLPYWISPLHLIDKWTGLAITKTKYTLSDTEGNPIFSGTKATIKHVVEPEGYIASVTYTKIPDVKNGK